MEETRLTSEKPIRQQLTLHDCMNRIEKVEKENQK